MVSTLYFILFFVTLLLLCLYLVKFGTSGVLTNKNSLHTGAICALHNVNQCREASYLINKPEAHASKLEQPIQFDGIDVNFEIKKQSRQLKRNLKTLEYISQLETNFHLENNPKRLADIVNLKKSVQRQIVKNTNILNKYRQAD